MPTVQKRGWSWYQENRLLFVFLTLVCELAMSRMSGLIWLDLKGTNNAWNEALAMQCYFWKVAGKAHRHNGVRGTCLHFRRDVGMPRPESAAGLEVVSQLNCAQCLWRFGRCWWRLGDTSPKLNIATWAGPRVTGDRAALCALQSFAICRRGPKRENLQFVRQLTCSSTVDESKLILPQRLFRYSCFPCCLALSWEAFTKSTGKMGLKREGELKGGGGLQ